jgi:hypothetical protein
VKQTYEHGITNNWVVGTIIWHRGYLRTVLYVTVDTYELFGIGIIRTLWQIGYLQTHWHRG